MKERKKEVKVFKTAKVESQSSSGFSKLSLKAWRGTAGRKKSGGKGGERISVGTDTI